MKANHISWWHSGTPFAAVNWNHTPKTKRWQPNDVDEAFLERIPHVNMLWCIYNIWRGTLARLHSAVYSLFSKEISQVPTIWEIGKRLAVKHTSQTKLEPRKQFNCVKRYLCSSLFWWLRNRSIVWHSRFKKESSYQLKIARHYVKNHHELHL